jgi:hypothetical protein
VTAGTGTAVIPADLKLGGGNGAKRTGSINKQVMDVRIIGTVNATTADGERAARWPPPMA